MPEPMPDFKHMTHAELVVWCETMWQQLQKVLNSSQTLQEHIQKLEKRIVDLETVKKTSLNSSNPPSKDQKVNLEPEVVQQKQRLAILGRKGGRSLHPKPDFEHVIRPDICAHCGSFLLGALDVIHAVYDKIELPEIKPSVTRVTQLACTCQACQKITIAIPPVGLEVGTPFGMSIQHLTLSLRFGHAISFAPLQGVLNDVFNVDISQGGINNLLLNALKKLKPQLEKIKRLVTNGEGVMSDETSVRVKGKNHWEWIFATSRTCLHVIRNSRGFDVIQEFFNKTKIEAGEQTRPAFWVSDLFGATMPEAIPPVRCMFRIKTGAFYGQEAQTKNPAVQWQVCLAHQLRDCKFAVDAGAVLFAPLMRSLFYRALEIHERRENLAQSTLISYQREVRRDLKFALSMTLTHKDAKRLLKRYLKIQDSLFVFLEHPYVPATNNASERRIRWSVIFRKVTNGCRSEWGVELLAGVRSVVNTGVLHGLSAFEAIRQALSYRGLLLEILNST
jgi:transposase